LYEPINVDGNLKIIQLTGKEFVWHSEIEDLEDVARKIFCVEKFTHNDWFKKSNTEMTDAISKYMSENNNSFLHDFELFCKMT
jgi:hypothetical protein